MATQATSAAIGPLALPRDGVNIVQAMKSNPTGVRFADAVKVATHYFGAPRQQGTSPAVWQMPWPADPRVNLKKGSGGKAKAYQIEQPTKANRTGVRPGVLGMSAEFWLGLQTDWELWHARREVDLRDLEPIARKAG